MKFLPQNWGNWKIYISSAAEFDLPVLQPPIFNPPPSPVQQIKVHPG